MATIIQDGTDVSGKPVMPKFMSHGESPEALVVDVSRISNAEYATYVQQHA